MAKKTTNRVVEGDDIEEQLAGLLGIIEAQPQPIYEAVQTPVPVDTPESKILGGTILAGDSWLSGEEKTALANTAFGQPVANTAIGGQKTSDVLNQLNKFEDNGGTFASGSTVVLNVGGNDLATGVDRGTIRDNINEIVSRLDGYGVNVILSAAPNANSYDEAISSTNLVMDNLYNDVAKTNKNVVVVDAMSGLLNQKNLMDESGFHLKDDASKLQFLNQLADAYKGEAPPLIAQTISPSSVVTQAAANPAQSLVTQSVDSLIKAGNLNPTQISAATGVPVGEIITKVASTVPQGQSITLGDTIIQPEYRVTGSGETQEIGNLETIYTSKTTGDVNYRAPVGSEYQQYNADGTFERTGTYQKTANSFLGGLAEAFNDPIVQAIVLGLGGGGALGNALGLTGSTAQAVGTGLLKSGAAAAGGASLEDTLKTGLLSGGLVYGGNALNNYLTTGTIADPSITERQFAIQDAKQLADQGLTATQIKDTLSSGGYNDITIERALSSLTGTPVAVSTPVTDTSAVNITAPSNVSLNNVLSTIAATAPVATSTPVTDGGTVKVTAPSTQMTTQQAVDLVNSQIAANVKTPTNLANVQITAPKTTTTQDVINTIAATLPALTVGANTPAITTTTPEIATQTITAKTPTKIGDALAAITTIPSTLTTTPVTSTTTTTADKTKETDPLKVAQLALAAAGLLGAGSALSNSGTKTSFPIVPIPAEWKPPTQQTAQYQPLTPIDFGNRNLLIGTQWEKFLDPNYGQVPQQRQYTQPSNLSYNDLMGILGSRQGMPPASSLSINDVISGIQNQYGQTPTRTMG